MDWLHSEKQLITDLAKFTMWLIGKYSGIIFLGCLDCMFRGSSDELNIAVMCFVLALQCFTSVSGFTSVQFTWPSTSRAVVIIQDWECIKSGPSALMNNVKTKYFIVFLIHLLILFCTFIAFRFVTLWNVTFFFFFFFFFIHTKLIFIFVITFYTALARHLCPAHLVSR